MHNQGKKQKGFTLIEILLVLVIISSVILLSLNYQAQKTQELRRDKAALEYQKILNASLAYHLNNSKWPTTLSDLAGNYLPNLSTFNNPWGQPYTLAASVDFSLLYVYSQVPVSVPGNTTVSKNNLAFANALAGSLPSGFTATAILPNLTIPDSTSPCVSTSGTCYVVSSIPVPGQNLNNARSVNFAELYHHRDCVPAPVCPYGTTPQIFVIPVSVGGYNDPNSNNIYPVEGFTAYALGAVRSNGAPGYQTSIGDCDAPNTTLRCDASDSTRPWNPSLPEAMLNYWRVCLNITTAKGRLQDTNSQPASDWGDKVTILAITRCSTPNEPVGSPFTVYVPQTPYVPTAIFSSPTTGTASFAPPPPVVTVIPSTGPSVGTPVYAPSTSPQS